MKDNSVAYDSLDNETLIVLYQENKDIAIRDLLVSRNKRLVYKAANLRRGMSSLSYEDLVQEGLIGILIGIDKFDTTYSSKFSTYIYYWIKQRIDRAVLNTGSTIRLPVHLVNKINKLIYIENSMITSDSSVDTKQICDELDISTYQYRYLKFLTSQYKNIISLNNVLSEDASDSDLELIDFLSNSSNILSGSVSDEFSIETNLFKEDLSETLKGALSGLPERDIKILAMRFGLDGGGGKTLEEIGRSFNLTRERIRQIESRALKKLRSKKNLELLEAFYYSGGEN